MTQVEKLLISISNGLSHDFTMTWTKIHDYSSKIIGQTDIIKILIIAGIAITIIIGVIIILNQRKIRKELRQLREMMENQNKPNGEI